MKVRLGALTGTVPDLDGDGIYWADRSGEAHGVDAIYYGVKDGVALKLWPGEGAHRIVSLRLALSGVLAERLAVFAESTDNFGRAGASLALTTAKGRQWLRAVHRKDIAFDAESATLSFLNNTGPLAETILRGDYVTLAARAGRETLSFAPSDDEPLGELCCVGSFMPVTDCSVYAVAGWHKNAEQGAAGVMRPDGSWLANVQGLLSTKKSKKSGTHVSRYPEERLLNGVTGGPFRVFLKGHAGAAAVKVTLPENLMECTARVVEVRVKD